MLGRHAQPNSPPIPPGIPLGGRGAAAAAGTAVSV
jgi:hypothetical protein